MVNFNFNVDTEAKAEYEPLPAGWYQGTITGVEDKETRSGRMLQFTIDLANGRKVWHNVNYINASQKAEEIGRKQLGQLAGAVGLNNCTNSDQLLNQSCEFKLVIREDPNYGPSNEIKSYRALAGPPQMAPAQSQPAQAPQGAAQPPWANRG